MGNQRYNSILTLAFLFTSVALAEPEVLSDEQMDRITAGSNAGDTPTEVATGGRPEYHF